MSGFNMQKCGNDNRCKEIVKRLEDSCYEQYGMDSEAQYNRCKDEYIGQPRAYDASDPIYSRVQISPDDHQYLSNLQGGQAASPSQAAPSPAEGPAAPPAEEPAEGPPEPRFSWGAAAAERQEQEPADDSQDSKRTMGYALGVAFNPNVADVFTLRVALGGGYLGLPFNMSDRRGLPHGDDGPGYDPAYVQRTHGGYLEGSAHFLFHPASGRVAGGLRVDAGGARMETIRYGDNLTETPPWGFRLNISPEFEGWFNEFVGIGGSVGFSMMVANDIYMGSTMGDYRGFGIAARLYVPVKPFVRTGNRALSGFGLMAEAGVSAYESKDDGWGSVENKSYIVDTGDTPATRGFEGLIKVFFDF